MASKTPSLLHQLAQKVGSFRHTESEQQISARDYESRVAEMLKAWDDFYRELGFIGDEVENNNGVDKIPPFSPIFGSNPKGGDFLFLSDIGTTGEVLTSNGPNTLPSYQPIPTTGSPSWGDIIGTITDQTDLITYINSQGFITVELDPTVPAYSKSLNAFSVIKTSTDSLYVSLTGIYDNPSWLNSLEWNKITSSPTFRIDGGNSISIYNSLTKIDGGTA